MSYREIPDRDTVDVTDNISKVERQLETGEEKLAGLLVVQGPEVLTEDGEPIIEIREELDEEGNMICITSADPRCHDLAY